MKAKFQCSYLLTNSITQVRGLYLKLTKIKEKIVLSTFSVFSFVIEDVYQRIRIRSVLDKKIRTKRERKDG